MSRELTAADLDALHTTADQLHQAVKSMEATGVGGQGAGVLLEAAASLNGTSTGAVVSQLAGSLSQTMRGLATSVESLGQGLRLVAEAYAEVDAGAANAAMSLDYPVPRL